MFAKRALENHGDINAAYYVDPYNEPAMKGTGLGAVADYLNPTTLGSRNWWNAFSSIPEDKLGAELRNAAKGAGIGGAVGASVGALTKVKSNMLQNKILARELSMLPQATSQQIALKKILEQTGKVKLKTGTWGRAKLGGGLVGFIAALASLINAGHRGMDNK